MIAFVNVEMAMIHRIVVLGSFYYGCHDISCLGTIPFKFPYSQKNIYTTQLCVHYKYVSI